MAILTTLYHRFYKNDGSVNAGGKVWTYEAGTTTPKTTYTDSSGTVANTNPVILNAHGEPQTGAGAPCDIWTTGVFKANLLESDDTQVTGWPRDNLGAGVTNDDANARWAGTSTGTANAIAIAPSPAITAYAIGQSFIFKAGASPNTAATTIAISGLTPIAAQSNGAAMAGGEILANNFYMAVLDTLTTCQISKIGMPTWTPRTIQTFTTGSGTYNRPAGCIAIKVRLAGGSGGGAGTSNGGTETAGTAGGNTTFGTLTANGGAAGAFAPSAGGSFTIGAGFTGQGIAGGGGDGGQATSTATCTLSGGRGGSSAFGGAGGAGNGNGNGQAAAANSGSGGGGAGCGAAASTRSGGAGAAGGYIEAIATSPSATYSYSIGTGGTGGVGATTTGGNGAAGIIIVEEYYV